MNTYATRANAQGDARSIEIARRYAAGLPQEYATRNPDGSFTIHNPHTPDAHKAEVRRGELRNMLRDSAEETRNIRPAKDAAHYARRQARAAAASRHSTFRRAS